MPKRDSQSTSTPRTSGSKRRSPSERQDESAGRAAAASNASSSSPSIQPNFDSSDPYAVLGVPRDATFQHIKLSYRKLALKHHPDRQSSETDKKLAHNIFSAIGHAYEILGDEGRRRDHDEGLRRQQQQQQRQQGRQHGRGQHGSSRDFVDMANFGHDPFSMFSDPFFSSSFGGRRSRGDGGRSSHPDFHSVDPFELFEQFFAEEMGHHGRQHNFRSSGGADPFASNPFVPSNGHHGRQHNSRSSGRADPFASNPFVSSNGFGGGGLNQMMSGHFGMMNSMMSQMHNGSMFGGFEDQSQQLMRNNGNGAGSSYNFSSSSNFSNHGGHETVSTSARTTIVNGVRKTIKERTVVHPDGRVERHVETIDGDGNDASRPSSANHPALGYDGGGRRRH